MGLFGNKYQEMPDLSGKTEKEAEQILKDHHLSLGTYQEVIVINTQKTKSSNLIQIVVNV